MIPAGKMTDRVAFYRVNSTADAYGNVSSGYQSTAYCTRWCSLKPQSSRERLEAGRLEASTRATLILRKDSGTETIAASDKAVINGVDYQVRSAPISNGSRDRFVQVDVERGVAVRWLAAGS